MKGGFSFLNILKPLEPGKSASYNLAFNPSEEKAYEDNLKISVLNKNSVNVRL